MSSSPVALSSMQSANQIQGGMMGDSNPRSNGFTPNDHDYDGLLRTAAPSSSSVAGIDANEIPGMTSTAMTLTSTMATTTATTPTTPTLTTTNSTNMLRTSNSYLVSGSGSSSGGDTATSLNTATTAASPAAGAVVALTLGGTSSGVSELKLKRVLEHNQRLREQLDMRRISVSEASQSNKKRCIMPVKSSRDRRVVFVLRSTGGGNIMQ
ncbi:hypothetical protein BGX28_000089 [Mortierella sp. GBA30]|nr:hypothetical protein BGX28_000089 [Mortierella sp. GBA30]